jgi:two-component system response regulator PilR (NtrC family)
MNFDILVLDDDLALRHLFSRSLSLMGNVCTVKSVSEARELLNEQRFDVFICDMKVGDELGIDLLYEVLPALRAEGTVVIALSADDDHFAECRTLGVDLIFAKPIMPQSLIHIVENVLMPEPHQRPA